MRLQYLDNPSSLSYIVSDMTDARLEAMLAEWLEPDHPMNPMLLMLAAGKSGAWEVRTLNGEVRTVFIVRMNCQQFRSIREEVQDGKGRG